MKNNLKFGLLQKFSLSLSLLIIITSMLLTFFLILQEQIRVSSDLKDKGYAIAKNMSHASEAAVLKNDSQFLNAILQSVKNDPDIIYIQVLDLNGRFLENYSKPEKVKASVFNINIPIESFVKKDQALKGPFVKEHKAKIIGEVKIGISLAKVDNTIYQIFQIVFGVTFGVVLFGILGVYFLTRYFLVWPLNKFIAGINKISGGDLSSQIKIDSNDEIGLLADSFNVMTRDLKKSRDEVEAHAEILEKRVKERTLELEQALEKLKTVDKMKTEFLSVVSHELKTPLTPIHEFTSLLIDGVLGETNPKQKEALESIRRQSSHLDNLIESIIDVSKMEMKRPFATRKEVISIENILKDIEEAVYFDLQKKNITLEKEVEKELPTVYADQSALKRLILNLLGNSVKFTPKGGKIKIRVLGEDKGIKCCIVDNGIGIEKENLEKIFEKFYQVDSSYTREAGGIGMGLAIAKGVIDAHNGAIWAESKGLGHGTSVCFTIPFSS